MATHTAPIEIRAGSTFLSQLTLGAFVSAPAGLVSCPISYNRFDRSDSSRGVGPASVEAMHRSDPPLIHRAAPRGPCLVPKVAPRLHRYFWHKTLVGAGESSLMSVYRALHPID